MKISRIFFYFCLAFVLGIFLSSLFFIPQMFLLGTLILGIFLISVFWSYKKLAVIGFCFLFLAAGIWRYQQALSGIVYPEEQQIIFVGRVVAEPDVRADNIKLTVKLSENGFPTIAGKVLVTVGRYPKYRYGDKLKIAGYLQKPHVFEDFNYKEYLSKDGIYSVMYRSEVELLERKAFTSVWQRGYFKILQLKDSLRGAVYRNLSPPQSTILGAMILGDKSRLSADLKEKLSLSGVRHITAVSGMHVSIITSALMVLFMGLGLWKKQAFWLTLALIVFFIVMTGLQPSAIRAGIMGSMFLLANYLGRQNFSSRAVVFAAVLMLLINPLLLRLDVGFQLSFLAMMGIIYLMPFLRSKLSFVPEEKLFNLRSITAMTLSAQIFTLPILIYNFGHVSLLAPLTNILIVPVLPLVMGLGFIFGITAIIFQPLGWILSWPVWLFLTYITKIVETVSQIPWASLTFENVHWAWLILAYLFLGCIAWMLKRKLNLGKCVV